MGRLQLTVASGNYDRVQPIIDGRVAIDGCDVNYLTLPPEECIHRALRNGEFEIAEIGFSPYLVAHSNDLCRYIAIPVFLSRMFRHSAIYIRTDRGIDGPGDLKGKTIGVPMYQMSAAMWPRGMLHDDHGIAYDEYRWRQGGLEEPGRIELFPLSLPEGFPLEDIAEGATLSAMLADGELDALFSARAPSCFRDGHAKVARLYGDAREAERDYYRRTGIFPIMHALGIRRDVHDAHPWLAATLFKAYEQARRIAIAELEEVAAFKVTLPWLSSEVAETRALMGEDFWPYGIDANRKTLETMLRYSYEQGLCARPLDIDELFASTTLSPPKI